MIFSLPQRYSKENQEGTQRTKSNASFSILPGRLFKFTQQNYKNYCQLRDTIIYNQLCKNLGNPPTDDQSDALKKIASYICDNSNDVIFLMTGYAGTGKTSVISAVVKTLDMLRMRSVLMAPTGRAAKVLASYSGKQAFTIHK